jgi:heparanase 1
MFTINAGPGPRDSEQQWQDMQARELIEYTVARDCPVSVWEFGNEIGAFGLEHNYPLDGQQYATDFALFAAMVDELDPDASRAGPASMYWPLEGEIFVPILEPLLAMQGPLVDIATWHYYPQQSGSCPVATRAVDKPILPLGWLDTIDDWAAEVEGYRDMHAPQTTIWLGETGHAQCGGEPGISDTFASSFWWLDQLGRMALRDQPLMIRQALSGGSYNLIQDSMLAPAPDYYASVLWKRHMGTKALAVQLQNAPDSLHAYAHCDVAGSGALVVLLINYAAADAADASLPVAFLDGTLEFEAALVSAESELATAIMLNGTLFEADAAGVVPTPTIERESGALIMPPQSYAFVRIPDAAAPACAG